MSTLKTNTIQHLTSGFNNIVTHTDGAGTVNAAHCRAWIRFNTITTTTITGSFNVSSLTDDGVGNTTINFTNALSDTNYCVCASTSPNNSANLIASPFSNQTPQTGTTSSFKLNLYQRSTGSSDDSPNVFAAVFR